MRRKVVFSWNSVNFNCECSPISTSTTTLLHLGQQCSYFRGRSLVQHRPKTDGEKKRREKTENKKLNRGRGGGQ